jgi:uncharacterized membrane protein
MSSMEISPTDEAEERIAALEKRVRDMDALVRGLLAELLDLKTVAMAMSRQDGERSRGKPVREPVPEPAQETAAAAQPASPAVAVLSEATTIIRPKAVSRQDAPAAPAEPAMVRIMQADGTMKMEKRFGNKKPY